MPHVPQATRVHYGKSNLCQKVKMKQCCLCSSFLDRQTYLLFDFPGDLWGYLRAATAEGEAEMQQLSMVSGEYLPGTPRT